MQEDKEAIFDAFDTVKNCLAVFAPMVKEMKVKAEQMRKAAAGGFINATDLADYLVGKGIPFRSAYKTVGQIVALCTAKGLTLEELPLSEYQAMDAAFESDLYKAIQIETCVSKRLSVGGPSEESVLAQIQFVKTYLK